MISELDAAGTTRHKGPCIRADAFCGILLRLLKRLPEDHLRIEATDLVCEARVGVAATIKLVDFVQSLANAEEDIRRRRRDAKKGRKEHDEESTTPRSVCVCVVPCSAADRSEKIVHCVCA